MEEALSHKGDLSEDMKEWPDRFASLSAELNAVRSLKEPTFASSVPVVGRLIVAIRRFWNGVSTKWYVQQIVEQQTRFNTQVVRSLDEFASAIMVLRDHQLNPGEIEVVLARLKKGFGFVGIPEEDHLTELDEQALWQWENADLPEFDRDCSEQEVREGEMQEEEITLNYPLHWRSRDESWRYLFDLALIGEALACRPGDLVLDYAAGPCWIAEFLNRLGIRTVSLDISFDMLQRGRRRLGCDRRLNRFVEARFTAGDALHLPFADESFDGVICMNAFHHIPSYGQALQEIYRILREGGRAVFSEPGAIHASDPVAQERMIHVGVLEKSVPLPLIFLLAKRAGFARMQVIPLGHPAYYSFEYTASPADEQALGQMWEQAIGLTSPAWARFVLEKGAQRPCDTHLPPHALSNHRLRAEISLTQTCDQTAVGLVFMDKLLVRNRGDVIWLSEEDPFGGQVCVGVKAYREDGSFIRDDLGRAPLPHDVAPGEVAEVEVLIPALLDPGQYLLKYDLVIEHVTWFEHHRSLTVQHPLEVVLLRAEISLSQVCQQAPAGSVLTDRIVVRNTGDIAWPAPGTLFGGEVNVGVKVYTEEGIVIRDDLGRTPIPRRTDPGEAVEVELHIPALLEPGRYLLKYDVVVEQVAWLEQLGSPTVQRFLEVTG